MPIDSQQSPGTPLNVALAALKEIASYNIWSRSHTATCHNIKNIAQDAIDKINKLTVNGVM